MSIITPTVGRKVWFRPNGATSHNSVPFNIMNRNHPLDATVIYVWNDRLVNLLVIDHVGATHAIGSVELRQQNDSSDRQGWYCEWMPYQVGQAQAKTAQPAP